MQAGLTGNYHTRNQLVPPSPFPFFSSLSHLFPRGDFGVKFSSSITRVCAERVNLGVRSGLGAGTLPAGQNFGFCEWGGAAGLRSKVFFWGSMGRVPLRRLTARKSWYIYRKCGFRAWQLRPLPQTAIIILLKCCAFFSFFWFQTRDRSVLRYQNLGG
jgi:hypothetical protein